MSVVNKGNDYNCQKRTSAENERDQVSVKVTNLASNDTKCILTWNLGGTKGVSWKGIHTSWFANASLSGEAGMWNLNGLLILKGTNGILYANQ